MSTRVLSSVENNNASKGCLERLVDMGVRQVVVGHEGVCKCLL